MPYLYVRYKPDRCATVIPVVPYAHIPDYLHIDSIIDWKLVSV